MFVTLAVGGVMGYLTHAVISEETGPGVSAPIRSISPVSSSRAQKGYVPQAKSTYVSRGTAATPSVQKVYAQPATVGSSTVPAIAQVAATAVPTQRKVVQAAQSKQAPKQAKAAPIEKKAAEETEDSWWDGIVDYVTPTGSAAERNNEAGVYGPFCQEAYEEQTTGGMLMDGVGSWFGYDPEGDGTIYADAAGESTWFGSATDGVLGIVGIDTEDDGTILGDTWDFLTDW